MGTEMEEKDYATQLEVAASDNGTRPVIFGDDEDFKFTFSKILALLSLVTGFFADIIIAVCVSSIISTINTDLGASPNYVWMVSANYVAVSVLSPFLGRLGDIFGRRNILIAGNSFGAIGCIIAATAQSVNAVIGGAVLIGIGSAGHQVAWGCIGEVVPRNYRPISLAAFESSVTPASVAGALIAYALVDHATWRWIYWISVILNVLALVLVVLFYHPVNQYIIEEGKTRWGQVKDLDWIGLLLFGSGLVLFLLGLSFGGTKFPWTSAGTLAPLLVGVGILIACGFWEAYTKNPYAIFPHTVMRNMRGFTFPVAITMLVVGMLYYSSLILFPLEIQTLFATTTTQIGLYSMALGLGGFAGSIVAGILFKVVDQARWMLVAIVVIATLFSGLQALVAPNSHVASTLFVVVLGASTSTVTIAANTIIQLSIPHQYLGVAMGLLVTARNVGGSISSTIYTSILSNDLAKHLGIDIATALAEAGVPLADLAAVTEALALGETTNPALTLATPAQLEAGLAALKLAYVHAFKIVYLVGITFGALAIGCALMTKNFGHLLTKKVDVILAEGAHIADHHDVGGHVIDHDGTELK